MKITNTSVGPRGLHTHAGHVMLEPDETVEFDVTPEEHESAKATGYFKLDGSPKALGKAEAKSKEA